MLERALDQVQLSTPNAAPSMRLLAVGKAAPFMASAFARLCQRPVDDALVVGTHCPVELPPRFRWVSASHPVPDARSADAGRQALELARHVPSEGLLVVLLSGGTSALLACPASPVTLEDKQHATEHLLRAGADIHALNAVRKHLSTIKGGRLAVACEGRTLSLVVSDVIGDDLSVIGSGPTVADTTSFEDAWRVLERFGGPTAFPPSVVHHLQRGCEGLIAETPKPGDRRLARATTIVIGSRLSAMAGARDEATKLGYDVSVDDEPVVGEARDAGAALAGRLRGRMGSGRRPRCLVTSGETTVTVAGSGKGGRNQELALAAALAMQGVGPFALLSAGTDGIDGPTDAAGAMVDSTTLQRARDGRADAWAALERNDSFPFFEALDDLVRTGPTDTNVGDLQVCLTAEAAAGHNEE